MNPAFSPLNPSVSLHHPMTLSFASRALIFALLYAPFWGPRTAFGEDNHESPIEQKIEGSIREFTERLGISQKINVLVVPEDPRLASLQRDHAESDAFLMSFDAGFLGTLQDAEIDAVIAHELGHLWIFTHFPFLQTEFLANQQALKLVKRHDLMRVYGKVRRWKSANRESAGGGPTVKGAEALN